MTTLTTAITEINNMHGADKETEHQRADHILLQHVPPQLADAYTRADQRAGGWWYA